MKYNWNVFLHMFFFASTYQKNKRESENDENSASEKWVRERTFSRCHSSIHTWSLGWLVMFKQINDSILLYVFYDSTTFFFIPNRLFKLYETNTMSMIVYKKSFWIELWKTIRIKWIPVLKKFGSHCAKRRKYLLELKRTRVHPLLVLHPSWKLSWQTLWSYTRLHWSSEPLLSHYRLRKTDLLENVKIIFNSSYIIFISHYWSKPALT